MDSDCTMSCKQAQELRRGYQEYAKLTETNKKKLVSSLAKDPPKLAEQEKYVCLRGEREGEEGGREERRGRIFVIRI